MDRLDKKKIILLITQSKYGGAQKYLLELARFFSQHNQVLIAVGEEKNQDAQFFAEARALGIEPIIIHSLIRDISLVKAWEATLEIRKLLKNEQPDFIHINSSMAGAIGACAAWLYRFDPLNKVIRVIYTVHGFVFNEPLPALKKQVYRIIEKVSAGWKGALICVSDYDKQQGIQHKIAPDARMVVIHNGINTKQELLTRSEARAQLHIPEDSFVVGTIAALYPTKGLSALLDAIQLLPRDKKMKFSILGDGPLRKDLETQATNLGILDSVQFHGAVPNASRLLKAFDISILPSLKEGLPLAILEAGLAGVPVIASRVGGIPEIIEHQVFGLLVEPGNAQDIALALAAFYDDPKLRASMSHALQKKVREEFTLDKMLQKTEELYLRFYKTTEPSSA